MRVTAPNAKDDASEAIDPFAAFAARLERANTVQRSNEQPSARLQRDRVRDDGDRLAEEQRRVLASTNHGEPIEPFRAPRESSPTIQST
jgi:hypothetical protein